MTRRLQPSASKKDGVQIDLGGIAKGYTSSRIMDIYREKGVTSGLVNLGGNAQVFGTKPDGSLWRVAVQSPDSEDEYLGVLEAKDKPLLHPAVMSATLKKMV